MHFASLPAEIICIITKYYGCDYHISSSSLYGYSRHLQARSDPFWGGFKYYHKFLHDQTPKMAEELKAAVKSFRKQEQLCYGGVSEHYAIMDNINELAKYAVAFQQVAIHIKDTKEWGDWIPLQIDYMVIPQAVLQDMVNVNKYKAVQMTSQREICGFDVEELVNTPKRYKAFQSSNCLKKAYSMNNFGEEGNSNAIWDIGETLSHPKVGYINGCDYFVSEIDIERDNASEILLGMLHQHRGRYNRYIFIIDRRNRQNIQRKNMYNKPSVNEEYRKKGEDMVYLILHKEYGKLPKSWYLIQESAFGLSRKSIIRGYNERRFSAMDYGLLSPFNGYKFGFSYHIWAKDNITPYFYGKNGIKLFELKDIKWLWPDFFMEINGRKQELNQNVRVLINEIQQHTLIDAEFEEFKDQCRNFDRV